MNSIAKLHQYLVARNLPLPLKKVQERETDNGKLFIMTLTIRKIDVEKCGSGYKKRDAERDACQQIIDLIESRNSLPEVVGGGEQSERIGLEKNPISKVQEFTQKYQMANSKWQQISSTAGPGNHFIVEGTHSHEGNKLKCSGQGSTKKEAKTNAAVELYRMLMWEHCKIKVEQTAIQEELPMATVVREVAEPVVLSYDYKGLAEFQGHRAASTPSSASPFSYTAPSQSALPDIDDLQGGSCQVPDEEPKDLEILPEYVQYQALTDQLQDIELHLKKLCIVSENNKVSYLVFVIIKQSGDTGGYMNCCCRSTLKEAAESVCGSVLAQLEAFGLDQLYTEQLLRNVNM